MDTLAEIVSTKISDRVEQNKKLNVTIMDAMSRSGGVGGGSREYGRRQREMQQHQQQGNIDLVSFGIFIDIIIISHPLYFLFVVGRDDE